MQVFTKNSIYTYIPNISFAVRVQSREENFMYMFMPPQNVVVNSLAHQGGQRGDNADWLTVGTEAWLASIATLDNWMASRDQHKLTTVIIDNNK